MQINNVEQEELQYREMGSNRILARTLAESLNDTFRDAENDFPSTSTSTLVSTGSGESEDA